MRRGPALRRAPPCKELLEFGSDYGTADSLPELDSLRRFIAEEDQWPVNWKIFTRRGLHSDRLRKWTGEPASLEQMIAASLHAYELHEFPDRGHFLAEETPGEIAPLLRRFLSRDAGSDA